MAPGPKDETDKPGGAASDLTSKVLAHLTPREQEVLQTRFGIGPGTVYSPKEVGEQFSATRKRIREIARKLGKQPR
jgi:DNA-directed RNA polymerase sigma subunit (sigma70/sigma32)